MSDKKEAGDGGLMYQQMRKFINIIDDLRDVGLQQHISLPRIVMLGGQSAGKSSVLESIVGIEMLPRGDGVVTRRPLELRLNHSQEEIVPWAKFEEVPGKKFTDFLEVKSTIEFLTDKICGKAKNIVDKPIVLTVYSHTCPDLTMIDLPGITRIPIDGQDQNIEAITKGMAGRYVGDPRTIILCVLPANADMTTSDGLQMAREYDPKGIRTIGVITKIDIMDKGTSAKRMIEGKDVALRLGFIGIKNRSQQDIIDRISVKAAHEKEQLFFGTHPIYSTMPQNLLGIGNLTNKLSKILFTHIKHNLPEIMGEIKQKLKETEDDLKDLGPPMPFESHQKQQLLWGMVTEFVQSYKNTISGKYDSKRVGGQQGEISGGAKVKMSFYNLYSDFEGYRACSEYTDMHIQKAIQMHEGDGLPGFPSVDVFIYLITPQLEKLRDPGLELLQDVYAQLEYIASTIVNKIFQRFPMMIPIIMDIIIKCISKERDNGRDIVEALLDSEQNYLFTNDKQYKEMRTAIVPEAIIAQPMGGQGGPGGPGGQGGQPGGQGGDPQDQYNQRQQQQQVQQPRARGENAFVAEMRKRIDDYFALVLRSVKDSIPKAIGYFLVKKSQEVLQFELYNQINNNDQLAQQLGEPQRITERRKALSDVMNTLKNALKVLQRDPDISSNGIGDEELEQALRVQAIQDKQEKAQGRGNGGGNRGGGGMGGNPGPGRGGGGGMGGPGGPGGQGRGGPGGPQGQNPGQQRPGGPGAGGPGGPGGPGPGGMGRGGPGGPGPGAGGPGGHPGMGRGGPGGPGPGGHPGPNGGRAAPSGTGTLFGNPNPLGK